MGRLPGVATSLVTHPWRWVGGSLSALLVLLMVALGAIGWIGSERAIHPSLHADLPRAEDFARLPLEDVAFLSRDGTRLAGWFVPSASGPAREAPTVLLLHGYRDRKEQLLPHAGYLHREGYNVLLFDFRARGESEGDAVTFGALERGDARGALDYLEARGDIDMRRVGVQGISMGAAVAIMVAARDDRVAGVVAEAPFKDLGSEVAASFQRRIGLPAFPFAPVTVWITERRLGISAPDISPLRDVAALREQSLLVIDDELDDSIAEGSARAVFEAAPEPKRYWLAPGAGHGQGHAAAPREYESQVLEFWASVLAGRERGGARRGRVVGDTGFEPVTSAMSTQRSNQLS